MNEKLGIYEELAAIRIKYAHHAYIPPHDRLDQKARAIAAARRLKEKPRQKKRMGLGPQDAADARAVQVIAAFCKAFEVECDAVMTPRRKRHFARPRQAIMHFLKKEMDLSYTRAGKIFQRDHTTAIHAFNKVEELFGRDADCEWRYDADFVSRYHRAVRALRALWAVPAVTP